MGSRFQQFWIIRLFLQNNPHEFMKSRNRESTGTPLVTFLPHHGGDSTDPAPRTSLFVSKGSSSDISDRTVVEKSWRIGGQFLGENTRPTSKPNFGSSRVPVILI